MIHRLLQAVGLIREDPPQAEVKEEGPPIQMPLTASFSGPLPRTFLDLTLCPDKDLVIHTHDGRVLFRVTQNSVEINADHVIIDGNRIDLAPANSPRRALNASKTSNSPRRLRRIGNPNGPRVTERFRQLIGSRSSR